MTKKQIILTQLTTDISQLIGDIGSGLVDYSGIIRSLNSCLGKVKELSEIEELELKDAERDFAAERDVVEDAERDFVMERDVIEDDIENRMDEEQDVL